jgi:hypothetical protein
MARLFCTVSALLGLIVLSPASAFAKPRVLFLEAAVASGSEIEPVIEVTRDQLTELGVELGVAPRPSDARLSVITSHAQTAAVASAAIAVVWLDTQRSATTIYFYEPKAPRLLTRKLTVSRSSAAAAEEVALILRSAISAVLEGEEVAMTEIEVPRSDLRPC